MAETLENGVADLSESSSDMASVKQHIPMDESKKQNGISNHKEELSNDSAGCQEEADDGSRETASSAAEVRLNGSNDKTEEQSEEIDSDDIKPDIMQESEMEVDNQASKDDDIKPSEAKEDSVDTEQETNDSVPKSNNMEDERSQSSEQMDVDEDSNAVDESSNISNAKFGSKNPSMVSEDSSRDSVDTIDSKSGDSDEASVGKGLISRVKDDDGGDILITLNEDDVEKDADDASKDGEKKDEESAAGKTDNDESSQESKSNEENNEVKENGEQKHQTPVQHQKPQVSLLTNMQQPVSAAMGLGGITIPTSLGIATGQTFFIQGTSASLPVGTQLVQQGSQLGYITRIGVQNIFVPVTNLTAPGPTTQVMVTQSQGAAQQAKPTPPPIDLEELKPKSSLEMVELMKWEIQNRIPDNSNWSVAFHPKKEELSAITSFLLELGHDVVKESVYKDIIQIQTKKKDAGDLKDNEIESLEKMKTVYENTKKKVEHLQLKNHKCNGCEFKTESATVLNRHKDFPHFEPPWDTSHGVMKCAHCSYKTKAAAQFSFHMSAIHHAEAKLPDKISCFQCELCPLNTTTKNKLDKHRQKCMKHFKLNVNLHPYYHDVNFCMKTCYYKPKKPVVPKPAVSKAPTVKSLLPQSSTPNMSVRKPTPTTPQMPLTPNIPSQMLPRPPPLQKMQPSILRSQAAQQKPGSFSHARPAIATARSSVPAAPRPTGPQPRGVRPQGKEMAGFEVCELCGGYVKDRHALRIHFYYAHKVEMPQAIFNRPERPLSCEVCKSKFWTTQGLTKHKSTLRHYNTGNTPAKEPTPGTNQQCFMCMRKVGNLFIHIENVHGMTMKDLVAMKKCIICGITAADRKNLEMHMASAHGVLIKANDFLSLDKQNSKPLAPAQTNTTKPAPPPEMPAGGVPVGKNAKPSLKQNLCVFCQLQFADNIQLTMHCIKNHATCTACGMVVQANKNLSSHNCRQQKRHCDICGMRNISPDVYVEHVRKLHMKPCKVEITKMSEGEIDEVKDKIKREYKPQIISLDSEEDSDAESQESGERRSRKSRSIENKENIEKAIDLSDNSDAEQGESNKRSTADDNEERDESSGESRDVKPEKVKTEDSVEGDIQSGDNSNGSRKRKASESLADDDGDEIDNKRVKVEGDDDEHSNGDQQEASGDDSVAAAMETDNSVKSEPNSVKSEQDEDEEKSADGGDEV